MGGSVKSVKSVRDFKTINDYVTTTTTKSA